jgi:hypothetical protein
MDYQLVLQLKQHAAAQALIVPGCQQLTNRIELIHEVHSLLTICKCNHCNHCLKLENLTVEAVKI